MSFTTSQLKDQFRLDVDDAEEPGSGDDSDSLWKDTEIYSYMDRAQKEFARITEIFLDSTDATITQLTVTANDPLVTLDPRIIDITRAKLNSTGRRLAVKKFEEMDEGYEISDYGTSTVTDWETVTGDPRALITNMDADSGRLYPIPTANDTLKLTVVRYPLKDITNHGVPLEVTNERYQFVLLDGMKWLAYEKQDADVFNREISDEFGAKFFSECETIKRELRRKRRPGRAIRYGGYE